MLVVLPRQFHGIYKRRKLRCYWQNILITDNQIVGLTNHNMCVESTLQVSILERMTIADVTHFLSEFLKGKSAPLNGRRRLAKNKSKEEPVDL